MIKNKVTVNGRELRERIGELRAIEVFPRPLYQHEADFQFRFSNPKIEIYLLGGDLYKIYISDENGNEVSFTFRVAELCYDEENELREILIGNFVIYIFGEGF